MHLERFRGSGAAGSRGLGLKGFEEGIFGCRVLRFQWVLGGV